MAVNDLPNYLKVTQGTAIVWGEAGGSGVTATLSFDALGIGSAIQGASVDLGSDFEEGFWAHLLVETGASAPTALAPYYAYLASSRDGSTWPGKVTGSAASYTRGSNDANLAQLGSPVITLSATPDANTLIYQNPVLWYPAGRYVAPVFVNDSGAAVRDQGTNSANLSRLILIPKTLKFID